MFKPEFLTRLFAVVLGIQLTGWALSVGLTPSGAQERIPLTPDGIVRDSLSATPSASMLVVDATDTATTTRN